MLPEGAFEVAIVGGAGHVGAPLAIVLGQRGIRTLVYDLNEAAMRQLAAGEMPFRDAGAEPALREAIARDMLGFTSLVADVASADVIIITIGTPVDEFQNPSLTVITRCIDELLPHVRPGQTIVLRSTVFPGVTEFVDAYVAARRDGVLVAFCPERAVEGHATEEIQTLPQIVSGTTPEAEEVAARLFGRIAASVVRMVPKEAEFAKLLCNAYRYIQFAAANQFYMMAEAAGMDHHRVLAAVRHDYPRMRDLPGPGFAAGPCLYKDTVQLAASMNSQFGLGHAAIQVNEGLPSFLVERLVERHPLGRMTVGLLGMAFKADSDDVRASLSYKLKKLLAFRAKRVLTTDPFVSDPELLPLDEVISRSDLLIVCVPHSAYRELRVGRVPVVDLWNIVSGEPAAPLPTSDARPVGAR